MNADAAHAYVPQFIRSVTTSLRKTGVKLPQQWA